MKSEPIRQMTRGHVKELAEALIGAVPTELTFDEVELVKADKGGLVAEVRQVIERRAGRGRPEPVSIETGSEQPQTPEFPPVPAIGEWFELEVDGDLDITPSNWTPLGPAFPGKRVYRAKLIELGYQPNLEAARAAAKVEEPKCVMAPGQAREAFMDNFPRKGPRPIEFGGNEWRDSDRDRRFACLLGWRCDGAWHPGFGFSGDGFSDVYLWLVLEQVEGA